MLHQIAIKAAAIRNPVEAAFFLWIHVAYLQAFADGNKRTGRLSANMPLLAATAHRSASAASRRGTTWWRCSACTSATTCPWPSIFSNGCIEVRCRNIRGCWA